MSSRELVTLLRRLIAEPSHQRSSDPRCRAGAPCRRPSRRADLRGQSSGPLNGLPFTVKDAIATGGVRSTGARWSLPRTCRRGRPRLLGSARRAPSSSARQTCRGGLVHRDVHPDLRDDEQPVGPVAHTGGSSGGRAAAVCVGLTSFDIGTDIAGSVGSVALLRDLGLKPTDGLVPERGYLDHVGAGATDTDLNVFGPIARDASDLDLLLRFSPADRRTTRSRGKSSCHDLAPTGSGSPSTSMSQVQYRRGVQVGAGPRGRQSRRCRPRGRPGATTRLLRGTDRAVLSPGGRRDR